MELEKLVELKRALAAAHHECDSLGERRDWDGLNEAEKRVKKLNREFSHACEESLPSIHSEIVYLRKENARLSQIERKLADAIYYWRDVSPKSYEEQIRQAIDLLGYDPDPDFDAGISAEDDDEEA